MPKYKLYNEDCLAIMKTMPENYIDLTVTSPPYDGRRDYGKSLEWDFSIFKKIAKELFRVTKEGGVVVWVVNDETKEGSESGTSFRQALYFKKIGFNLHDTMIYKKHGIPHAYDRYIQDFEYMFVFSKGAPKTFNQIKIAAITAGQGTSSTKREINGKLSGNKKRRKTAQLRKKGNVWHYENGIGKSSKDKTAFKHPAIFPEALAHDHIISWSNEKDLVFDPFLGSGTTGKMALRNKRKFVGCEKVKEYFEIAKVRIENYKLESTTMFANSNDTANTLF